MQIFTRLFKQNKEFYRNLLALSLPLIVQNIINSSLGMIDTAMLGALGEVELSSVTIANSPFFIIMLVCFGLQSGGSVLISQYWGKRDYIAINKILGISLYISCSVAAILTTLTFIFPVQVASIWTNNPELQLFAAKYIRIVSFGALINCAATIYIGAHRSMGNPKLGMYIFGISMFANCIFNYIFIFGKFGAPAMGVEGAALGTLLARVLEFIITMVYIVVNNRFKINLRALISPGKIITKDFVRYSMPVVANETLWALGFMVYPAVFGRMSSAYVAAYTITGNLDRLIFVVIFGVGSAVAVIVGNDIGAKKSNEEVYSSARTLMALAVVLGFIAMGMMLLFSDIAISIFKISDVAVSAAKFMIMINSFMMPMRALNFTNIVGVLRGGGDVIASVVLDIVPMYVFTIPAVLIASFVFGASGEIIYVLICTDEFSKFFFSLRRFISRKWIRNLTRDNVS